jgi:hypothetical protein
VAVDTLKQKNDIKDIQPAKAKYDWWKYLYYLRNYIGISSYLLVHQKIQKKKKRRYIKHHRKKATTYSIPLSKRTCGKRRS